MTLRRFLLALTMLLAGAFNSFKADATKFVEIKIVDKDYLMLHFKDGEVLYDESTSRHDAFIGHSSKASAKLGHSGPEDSLVVYGKRLDTDMAALSSAWSISSADDRSFTEAAPLRISRKSKAFGLTHAFESEQDHWLFLELPRSMRQGCTYTVNIPDGLGSDVASAEVKFDIWNSQSEAVHVNIMGYSPKEKVKGADLYLWLGDGGYRDYKKFEGRQVYLYNVETGRKKPAGSVRFWKHDSDSDQEFVKQSMTGSDVWNIDFKDAVPGKYRLVVDGVGCSMDFEVSDLIYHEPYKYSLLGYYYMRVGEPITPGINPAPRQPMFVPEQDPGGFTIYITDLNPWTAFELANVDGDIWDEPHFRPALTSAFWRHRLPGNPTNPNAVGGHSDAYDWDRYLGHVSNIYDMLLPFILTDGKLAEDDLGIRESGNGIPDLIDEARNEVDFFLSLRDPEGGYSPGLTNPSEEWTVMFQAGSATIAAWANAANSAMLAEAFRINGNTELQQYYTAAAVEAYEFALRQPDQMLGDRQFVGTTSMRGRDFKQMAAAYLYNLTGDRRWEDDMAAESVIKDGHSPVYTGHTTIFFHYPDENHCQVWGTLAYLTCPHERHYPELYTNMLASVNWQADEENVNMMDKRPSRRSSTDGYHTAENLQLVMIAHKFANSDARRSRLEKAMYLEAGWGLGRNPANIIEMTGLGQRHFENVYSTGRHDGFPGTHPGQTPYNRIDIAFDTNKLFSKCYPSWTDGGWPRQESFFEQRYSWYNGEFTPRETMRGKMALLAYLYGIR